VGRTWDVRSAAVKMAAARGGDALGQHRPCVNQAEVPPDESGTLSGTHRAGPLAPRHESGGRDGRGRPGRRTLRQRGRRLGGDEVGAHAEPGGRGADTAAEWNVEAAASGGHGGGGGAGFTGFGASWRGRRRWGPRVSGSLSSEAGMEGKARF
jgi:hypothetical protein